MLDDRVKEGDETVWGSRGMRMDCEGLGEAWDWARDG